MKTDGFILQSSQVEGEEEVTVGIIPPPPVTQLQNTHATSAAKIFKRKGSFFLRNIMSRRENECLEKNQVKQKNSLTENIKSIKK